MIRILPLLALTAFSEAAQAQTIAGVSGRLESERSVAITASDNDQRTGLPVTGLTLEAANDASEVSLTLTSKSSGILGVGEEERWSIVAKAPLDKDEGSGTFVTEQGLSNQFAIEAGYTAVFDPGIGADISKGAEAAGVKFRQNCEQKAPNHPEYPQPDPLTDQELEFSQDIQRYIKWQRHQTVTQKRDTFINSLCIGSGGIHAWDNAKLAEYGLNTLEIAAIRREQQARKNRNIWILNAAASMGYGRYTFFSPATFAEAKDEKISYSFSLSGGVHLSKNAPFFGAGYEYKREFEAADKRVVCPPNPNPGTPTDCQYNVFDAPEKNVSHNVFALMRVANFARANPNARFRLPIAAELRAAYDIHDKIFGISVPIYFLLDEKGGFRGGTKFSWADGTKDTNDDEFKVSVFVVKSFDFFKL